GHARSPFRPDHGLCAVRLRQFRQCGDPDRRHERPDAGTTERDRASGLARHGLGNLGERAFGVHDRPSHLSPSRAMRLFPIWLSLILMGCAVASAPVENQSVTPHFEGGALVARDGTRLPLREWDAQGGEPKAVIIGLHGMSDYSNA